MDAFIKGDIDGSIEELFDHQKIKNKEYQFISIRRMKELRR